MPPTGGFSLRGGGDLPCPDKLRALGRIVLPHQRDDLWLWQIWLHHLFGCIMSLVVRAPMRAAWLRCLEPTEGSARQSCLPTTTYMYPRPSEQATESQTREAVSTAHGCVGLVDRESAGPADLLQPCKDTAIVATWILQPGVSTLLRSRVRENRAIVVHSPVRVHPAVLPQQQVVIRHVAPECLVVVLAVGTVCAGLRDQCVVLYVGVHHVRGERSQCRLAIVLA